jgi:hypothetical protein
MRKLVKQRKLLSYSSPCVKFFPINSKIVRTGELRKKKYVRKIDMVKLFENFLNY